MNPLVLAIILTILPVVELRGGLPVALLNASKEGVSQGLIFLIIVALNILMVFVAFFFLDYLHKFFLRVKSYKRFYEFTLRKMQNKIDKFEKAHDSIGVWALFLFVAIPFPLTGAYSGVLLSWLFGLPRKKSIMAISLGVITAGIIVYLGTIGITSFLG
jgi:uncharacterized membrane protein